jgi:hypothetical protein
VFCLGIPGHVRISSKTAKGAYGLPVHLYRIKVVFTLISIPASPDMNPIHPSTEHVPDHDKHATQHIDHGDMKHVESDTVLTSVDPAFERRLLRKIDFRLIPALCEWHVDSAHASVHVRVLFDRSNEFAVSQLRVTLTSSNARLAGMDAALGTQLGDRYSIITLVCKYTTQGHLISLYSLHSLRDSWKLRAQKRCSVSSGHYHADVVPESGSPRRPLPLVS